MAETIKTLSQEKRIGIKVSIHVFHILPQGRVTDLTKTLQVNITGVSISETSITGNGKKIETG